MSGQNGPVEQDLAVLIKSIDPGVLGMRIRRARLAAGLTQTQLVASDASTAYLSRIEAGQRRPDLKLLRQITQRLQISVDELLTGITRDRAAELQLALDHAELALASGDAAAAVSRAGRILADIADLDLPELGVNAQIVHALALESCGQLDEALDELEELMAATLADDRRWQLQIALCRCYRESGDLAAAIDTGEKSLSELEARGLAGAGEGVQVAVTVAAAYFERGDTIRASRLCRQAIRAAERLESPAAKAAAYWNASVMESKEGDSSAALALARTAMSYLEAGEHGRNLGRLRTQLGILQLRADPPEPESARETLERAKRELDWSNGSIADKTDNQLAQARAAFLLGDIVSASAHAFKARQEAGDRLPFVAADARVLEGQIATREGDVELATQAYRDAVSILTSVGSDRQAAQLWFDLGEFFAEVGHPDEARDAYRRAAASTGLRPARSRSSHV